MRCQFGQLMVGEPAILRFMAHAEQRLALEMSAPLATVWRGGRIGQDVGLERAALLKIGQHANAA